MYKDNHRSTMWETTVRKTQQQQLQQQTAAAAARRRGCGIFPNSSVVPADDADGASSAGTTPTTPTSAMAEEPEEGGGGGGSYGGGNGDEGTEEVYHAERLLPNGDFYTGLWSGNLPHGTGKYLWTDGCMYEGEWRHGKTMGKGKFSWPSGATYEGEFKTGFMDGFGTYIGSSGDTYRGAWSMNLKNGHGKKSYPNGDYYDGEWRCGVQEGHGRYVWKNGNEYTGSWKGGVIHGRGTLVWSNGNCYDGEWEDGMPCGKGQFRWGDGSRYVGVWSKDHSVKKGIYYPSPASAGGDNLVRDLQEAFAVDLGDCKICPGESVSILPSQKTLNWSGIEADFLQKQAVWRSSKVADTSGGSGSGRQRRRTSVDANRANRRSYAKSFHNITNNGSGGFDKICIWESEGDITCDIVDGSAMVGAAREGSNDGSGASRSEEGAEGKAGVANQQMKGFTKEMKKQGETISKGHKNYDLMLNLQLGIRYSVGKPAPATTFDLKASAFDPKEKVWTKFPPEGSKHTPPHQSSEFKWKDYCPVVFRTLRKLFKIDAGDYMMSICGNDALRELSSPGKSGSFFYLTHDDRYMIKTVKKSEVKVLLRMLPAYYNHVRAFENTLVTKFFGLHCVKLTGPAQKKVRFVIMGNLFCSEYTINRRFDLKGSSHGRTTDKPEEEIDENTTLKDLDLKFIFRLQRSWFQEFVRQVDRDCEFLEQERIMDYSLLVGLHFRDASSGDPLLDEVPNDHGAPSEATPRLSRADMDHFLCDPTRWATIRLGVNMPARVEQTQRRSDCDSQLVGEPTGEFFDVVLFFGIIDILQDYDISKKLEHAYKSIQYDPTSISAVDPKQYSRRFRDFIYKVFKEDI
ncbi:hypothetical protein Taro_010322 [Colocasia esculenta]|uniref:1-phosphatidylinositol-4-phosphate 5-kinase n=1 Tax=Colocasia esculenta TaxID=4460 RepID=A0A843U7A9_COLES|nr:hypothetical protein [Colocasia esculenta]